MPIDPDPLFKIATPLLALVGTCVSTYTAWRLAKLNNRNAIDMADLKAKTDKLSRNEERIYVLRASQITPFLDRLHDSIYLSKSMIVAARGASRLPFPADVLRALLLTNKSLNQLFEVNNDLVAKRASVLMGIAGSHINDFSNKSNTVLDMSLRGCLKKGLEAVWRA